MVVAILKYAWRDNMELNLHSTDRIKSLLKAYLDKSISNSDRFELEKLALDDDFLFEALEGFEESKVNTLPKFNYNKIKTPKIKVISARKWMSIAASLLLFCGVVYYYYTNRSVNQINDEITQSSVENNTIITPTTQQPEVSDEEVVNAVPLPDTAPKKPKVDKTAMKVSLTASQLTTSDKSVELENNESQSVAIIPSAKATKPNYSEEPQTLRKSIVLSENEQETTSLVGSLDQPYPEIGFEKLREIIKNSGMRQRAFILRCAGEIEIHFIIDKDGKPTDFKVINPHCPPCEELLEELIRGSGKWIVPPKAPNREAAYIYRIL